MQYEDFLENPLFDETIPKEWLRAYYDAKREEYFSELRNLAWEIGKAGDLLTGRKSAFDEVLTDEEVALEYGVIRDASGRLECEWRSNFKRLYPSHCRALPPIQHPGASKLFLRVLDGIDQADMPRFRDAFAQALAQGALDPFSLSCAQMFAVREGQSEMAMILEEAVRALDPA